MTVLDKKTGTGDGDSGAYAYLSANLSSFTDYYPFGMPMPERNGSSTHYRMGFNGMEQDDEIKGKGNSLDFGARFYDSRLGRFLSIDPYASKFPWNSNYSFAENNVIQSIDHKGLHRINVTDVNKEDRVAKIEIVHEGYIIDNINLNDRYRNMDPQLVSDRFSKGNTVVYVRDLPVNGVQPKFISEKQYNKGIGYKINVEYNVTVQLIKNPSKVKERPEGIASVIHMPPTVDVEDNVGAYATVTLSDKIGSVTLNPRHTQLAPDNVISHEMGSHNMLGERHIKVDGIMFYTQEESLNSNNDLKVQPNIGETRKLIENASKYNRVDYDKKY